METDGNIISHSLCSRAWNYIKHWKKISEKDLFEFSICQICFKYRNSTCMFVL